MLGQPSRAAECVADAAGFSQIVDGEIGDLPAAVAKTAITSGSDLARLSASSRVLTAGRAMTEAGRRDVP
jgi:hypothetical protein